MAHPACRRSRAWRAVSGESADAPDAFLMGANSSSRRTSKNAVRCARGRVSKMKSSNLIPYTSAGHILPCQ